MPKYDISRAIEIQCTPAQAYETVADYRTWTTWSPWLLADPQAKVTTSPQVAAVGSTYAWDGPIVGAGELVHQVLVPGKRIEDELRFLHPFKSVCRTTFTFAPAPHGTRVTWDMHGSLPWYLFWMAPMLKTFLSMDYHRGLTMLRDLIQTNHIPSRCIVHGQKNIDPVRMAGIADRCSVFDVGPSMEQAFKRARGEFQRLGLPTDGDMISVYTKFRTTRGEFDYISGWAIPATAKVPASALKVWTLPTSPAFQVDHIGSYAHLGNGWSVANQLVRHQKLKQQRCGTFEIYRTTPPETPDHELLTEIYLPLRS